MPRPEQQQVKSELEERVNVEAPVNAPAPTNIPEEEDNNE